MRSPRQSFEDIVALATQALAAEDRRAALGPLVQIQTMAMVQACALRRAEARVALAALPVEARMQ